MNLKIKLLDKRFQRAEVPLPEYKTAGSAGLDLRCMSAVPIYLRPGDRDVLPTGIAIHISVPNVMGLIAIRSGCAREGLQLQNSIGVIDSDYQGEILLAVMNTGQHEVVIKPCDRVAQLILVPVIQAGSLSIVTDFQPTARGTAGFGSTGKQ